MRGEIKIVNMRTREHIATLEWDGTLWDGVGAWKSDAATKKRLDAIIASRDDLKSATFSDMLRDGFGVRGWQGFSGWFQALTLALPAFGLDIDNETVVWPWESPSSGGDEEEDGDQLEAAGSF